MGDGNDTGTLWGVAPVWEFWVQMSCIVGAWALFFIWAFQTGGAGA